MCKPVVAALDIEIIRGCVRCCPNSDRLLFEEDTVLLCHDLICCRFLCEYSVMFLLARTPVVGARCRSAGMVLSLALAP